MSDDTETPKPTRRGRGLLGKLMPLALGLLLGGIGVGGGLYVVQPDLVRSLSAPATAAPIEAEEGEAHYYPLSQPFTSNLKDSQQFVQLSISLGTYGDEAFIEALKTHEMALRSAALMKIADQTYAQVSTSGGKAALAATLKGVLNRALKERHVDPAIDTVYFTGFVIQ